MIVAPLTRVISVVPPIASYEVILAASVVASIVVSVKAIVVRPEALLNSLALIAVARVPRSARLLPASAVTFVRLTATVVLPLRVLNSAAVVDVASAASITMV